jgi:hypothetical protein
VFGQTPEKVETPAYQPEINSFSAGSANFGDLDLDSAAGNGVSDEDMLATMMALNNPAWWQNMMMPGCIPSSPF